MRPLGRPTNFKTTSGLFIASFALLTIFVKQFDFFGIDLKVTQAIQDFNLPLFRSLMIWVSRLGDVWPGLASVIFFSLAVFFTAKKKRLTIMIWLTVASMVLINQTVKFLIARPRPSSVLIQIEGVFKNADSFPSGHVMFFIALYGFLLFFVDTQFKKSWLRGVLMITFCALLILIGLSRIYLGVHWFSDVLGAYLLGFYWLFVIIWIYKKHEDAI